MTNYNFSAGPGVLPTPVLTKIKDEFTKNEFTHMSIIEISHRSSQFEEIIASAEERLRDLMNISDDYGVAFIQGGGSTQFEMLPLNFANRKNKIAVLDSGNFAAKAATAATAIGKTAIILDSSKDDKYHHLPMLSPDFHADDYDYLHLTTNNTIEGATYHQDNLPKTTGRMTADMSSNILAEPYDVNQFDAIFAGAQKNLGPAGVTVAIVKKDWLAEQNIQHVGSMLRYQSYLDKHSMYNTPPVFSIYALDLVLEWVQEQGGVDSMYAQNIKKSSKLYDYIDNSSFYQALVDNSARSLTNVVFTTNNLERDQVIAKEAAKAGLFNLNGHRSVGGFRASLYNAQPQEAVDALITFLKKAEKEYK
ncbi:3-phosphoserine/phosphohydroxythreonine transaminase [Leuconostoc litchii]|uniref:Phosphoserine aminotransferase n=1 Tax=Leuconostoc litchii TaxID=1981069 RepID=A0A6P2CM06_9LACO|nr:3-phosphoserine/phosphohydroxythreonine transaminase [Leuconostoc litchii]TYC46624.1 3-phosphoserine/phosphohydroxythreonine transaminase [Leuconostoc litchii]